MTRYRENREQWHKQGFRFDKKHAKNWPYKKQLRAYKKGLATQWDNPNSVDIHSLQRVGNIKAYMIKYMSKNKGYTDDEKNAYNDLPEETKKAIREKDEITGRLWSCSSNLVDLRGGEMDVDSLISDELHRLHDYNNKMLYVSDYFHVFTVDIAILRKLNCVILLECFERFIRKKFPEDYLKVIT